MHINYSFSPFTPPVSCLSSDVNSLLDMPDLDFLSPLPEPSVSGALK